MQVYKHIGDPSKPIAICKYRAQTAPFLLLGMQPLSSRSGSFGCHLNMWHSANPERFQEIPTALLGVPSEALEALVMSAATVQSMSMNAERPLYTCCLCSSGLMTSASIHILLVFNTPGTWPCNVPIVQDINLMSGFQCWQVVASVSDIKTFGNKQMVKMNQACQLDMKSRQGITNHQ